MTWAFLGIAVLALFALLCAVPIGVFVLLTSPEARYSMKRFLSRLAPVGLAGLLLALLLGPTRDVVHPQAPSVESLAIASPVSLQSHRDEHDLGDVIPESGEPADATRPVTITNFAPGSETGRTVPELPAWVKSWGEEHPPGDVEQFVLVSRRYADAAEAEGELLAALQPRLNDYLQRGGLPGVGLLTMAMVRNSQAVQARAEEQFLVDLGSTQEPVYRVTWQVLLQPSVREAIGNDYRLAVRNVRLWQLGVGMSLATLMLGAWAGYFRINDATQGRYRGRLKLAAIGASLAVVGATMLV